MGSGCGPPQHHAEWLNFFLWDGILLQYSFSLLYPRHSETSHVSWICYILSLNFQYYSVFLCLSAFFSCAAGAKFPRVRKSLMSWKGWPGGRLLREESQEWDWLSGGSIVWSLRFIWSFNASITYEFSTNMRVMLYPFLSLGYPELEWLHCDRLYRTTSLSNKGKYVLLIIQTLLVPPSSFSDEHMFYWAVRACIPLAGRRISLKGNTCHTTSSQGCAED